MTAKKFDFSTVDNFDKHINDSISGFTLLDSLIVDISSFFIKKHNNAPVVDLGCTSGRLIDKIQKNYGCKCIGYDITDHNFIEGVDCRVQDITKDDFEIPKSQIVYSIFTMQFLSFDSRVKLIRKIRNAISEDGVFIFCEKEYASTAKFQEIYTFANYDNKKKGFTSDEILQKEIDIRSLMSPLSESGNKLMLKECGFNNVDIFFKSLNFTGYICMI